MNTSAKLTGPSASVAMHAENLKRLVAEHDRLLALVPQRPLAFDLGRISSARRLVQDIAAAVVLGEQNQSQLDSAREECAELERASAKSNELSEQVEQAIAGLQARMARLQEQIRAERDELSVAEVEFLRSLVGPASADYVEKVIQAGQALRHFYAVHEALSRRGVKKNNMVSLGKSFEPPIVDEASFNARKELNQGIGGRMMCITGRVVDVDVDDELGVLEGMLTRLRGEG